VGWARRLAAGLAAGTVVAGCSAASSGGPPSTGSTPLTISIAPLGSATSTQLHQAFEVVNARLRGLHLGTARLARNRILVTASTADTAQVERVATDRGEIRFRQVLQIHRNASRTADPTVNRANALTTPLRTSLTHWNCRTDSNPTDGADQASDYILACDRTRTRVYLLAPATLGTPDVQSASSASEQVGSGWLVNVKFTKSGARRWFALTKQSYAATNGGDSGYPDCAPPTGCNAIGIALDGIVESDPATQVDGIPGGLTQLSGNFSKSDADFIAAVLDSGQLPIALHVVS
jgi:preprotein translocase subunit SecD